MKTTVYFVVGEEGNLVDEIITHASKGPYSHVAIFVPGVGLVESWGEIGPGIMPPCVRLAPLRKFDGRSDVTIARIDLPNLAAAQDEAERLIGTPYGYPDCATTGLRELFGIKPKGNGILTAHCSETVARILRAGEYVLLPEEAPDNISPNAEAKELLK